MRILTQRRRAFDEILGGDHRIPQNTVADAIDRQPPVVVVELHPEFYFTCRSDMGRHNQPNLESTQTRKGRYRRESRTLLSKLELCVRLDQFRFEFRSI